MTTPAAKRVLIVDDEPQATATLAAFLSRRGYAIVTAHDGIEAVRQCYQNAVDLVLTDMRMPGMDGGRLIDALRRQNPALPIVIMTGQRGYLGDEAPALPAVAAVLTKPLDLRAIERTIAGLVDDG